MDDFVPDLDILDEPIDGKDVSVIHAMSQSCSFNINIPGHEPRTTSDVFAVTRKHLIDDLDTPCWICGSKDNRQVHHYYLEWALSDACDWTKLKLDHPDFTNWAKIDPSDITTFKFFVDDAYNMKVLCQPHHTGTGKSDGKYGIHAVPLPIWSFQKYVKDGFTFINIPSTAKFFDPGQNNIIQKIWSYFFRTKQ